MDEDYREVDFETYCKACKYKNLSENKDPCDECLDIPINLNTTRPIKFEAKE